MLLKLLLLEVVVASAIGQPSQLSQVSKPRQVQQPSQRTQRHHQPPYYGQDQHYNYNPDYKSYGYSDPYAANKAPYYETQTALPTAANKQALPETTPLAVEVQTTEVSRNFLDRTKDYGWHAEQWNGPDMIEPEPWHGLDISRFFAELETWFPIQLFPYGSTGKDRQGRQEKGTKKPKAGLMTQEQITEVLFEAAEEKDLLPEIVVDPTTTTVQTTTVEEMTTTTVVTTTIAPETTTTTEATTTPATTAPLVEEAEAKDLVVEVIEDVPVAPEPEEVHPASEKEVYITSAAENSTVVPPEVVQYHVEKDKNYGFAKANLFPQRIVDAAAYGGDSGRDELGGISSFSYFRPDVEVNLSKPFRPAEKARSLVLDQFNRYMADSSTRPFDWSRPESTKTPPSGSDFISSSNLPTPKRTYGVPKSAPYKSPPVPKTSYGVPKAAPISDAPAYKNAATLADIIVPKQYVLENGSSLPPAK